MKLQISFDSLSLQDDIEIAKKIVHFADILEIGTLPILKYGAAAIEQFRAAFPQAVLFADTKIIDKGRDIASLFAQAGADWISVMAGTHKDVITGVCSKAHDMGKKVMLDMLDASSPGQKALEAKNLGVDAIMFHQCFTDNDSALFLEEWSMVQGNSSLPIFISVKAFSDSSSSNNSIDTLKSLRPYALVIGSPITDAIDSISQAQFFHDVCKK